MDAAQPAAAAQPPTTAPDPKEPPALTPAERQQYTRVARKMDMFHEHFRRTWAYLHGACTAGSRPPGVSIREFLSAGLGFLENLEGHHDIEEYYVFPALARRIPEFSSAGVLTAQHGEIHAGMDRMKALLEACRKGERELRLSELKEVMDSFGPALMRHLDQEVRLLEPENLSRYYRVDELGLIPGLS